MLKFLVVIVLEWIRLAERVLYYSLHLIVSLIKIYLFIVNKSIWISLHWETINYLPRKKGNLFLQNFSIFSEIIQHKCFVSKPLLLDPIWNDLQYANDNKLGSHFRGELMYRNEWNPDAITWVISVYCYYPFDNFCFFPIFSIF